MIVALTSLLLAASFPQARTIHAPRHDLRLELTADGTALFCPHRAPASWSVSLQLLDWGRPNRRDTLTTRSIHGDAQSVRVELGALTEWFVSDDRGVEQIIRIERPPAGTGELIVRSRFSTMLTPVMDADARGLVLNTPDGRRLARFDGLLVVDAAGTVLPARMQLDGELLGFHVDDAGAAYPVTIDPIFATETVKLIASDGSAFHEFGSSVLLSGDTLVVGGVESTGIFPQTGAAYVFEWDGTSWNEAQKLFSPDASGMDRFGFGLDISGDTLAIGARRHDIVIEEGAVYVYTHDGSSWSLEQKLFASDGFDRDAFGHRVAVDQDWLIASADGVDDFGANSNSGAVYSFQRSGTQWVEVEKLTSSDLADGDRFGTFLAMDGDTLVVGAPNHDHGAADSGAAYVFERTGSTWNETLELLPAISGADFEFGTVCAISGDRIVVGTKRTPTSIASGSVHVFDRSGSGWVETARLTTQNSFENDFYGRSVAIDGDRLLVGAYQDSMFGLQAGRAYLYEFNGVEWTLQQELFGSDTGFRAEFGFAVSLDAGRLSVGARGDPVLGEDSGAAYVHEIAPAPHPAFCFSDGTGAGCHDCPCGNEVAPGTRSGCANSTGLGGMLAGSGDSSLANDSLVFEASGLSGTVALLVSADNRLPNNPMNPCFGMASGALFMDGRTCVGGNLLRHGTRSVVGGTNATPWGPPGGPPGGLVSQFGFLPGQTRHWMAIYRDDPNLSCGHGINFSNGVSVVVTP